jgi:uncharacterized protein
VEIINLLAIFVITLLTRIMTVTTGGGGMILIPLLIFFGLPPSQAIATNRVGGLSSNVAILKFHKHGKVKWKLGVSLIIPTLIGAIAGASIVVNIDQDLFKKLLGSVILISLLLLTQRGKIGIKGKKISKGRFIAGWFLTILASFLGGMFASTGVWFTYVYLFLGLTFLQSAATRKITGPMINLSSLVIFWFAGLINWQVAGAMFLASAIGAWIGAGIGLKLGNIWIKRLFIFFAVLSALKLIF